MDLAWTHGWMGWTVAYASVQGPMLAGLVRGKADFRKFLASPLVAAPLTAITGVALTVASPLLSGLGADPHGLIRFAIGTMLAAGLGYAGGRSAAEDPKGATLRPRGAQVVEQPAEPPAPGPSRDRVKQITLGRTPIPVADETKHFKLIGTTGTGKSTAVAEMLTTALERGDRAVIADPDGGYLRRFYDEARGDVILNPFDSRSLKWDFFGELRDSYDIEHLARSLIPDAGGTDRIWSNYARTFFAAVTRRARDAGIGDIGELFRLLVVADVAELRTLVAGTAAQPFLDEHNSRMFDSIRTVTSSAVGALEHVAQQNAALFSIREWVRGDSRGVLFMPYKAGQIAALRSSISGWMRLAIFQAMDRDEQTQAEASEPASRLWFVVDELDALGQIDGLKDALARLRKFGGRCVLGFQSIAQVSNTYGQGDAHTIVENCGNTLILRCSASEGGGTARFASQLIGEREVVRSSTSRSHRYSEMFGSFTRSDHLVVETAVLPAQIEQLPDLSGYLKHASDPRWQRIRLASVREWSDRRAADRGAPPRSDQSREGIVRD